ncbi:hypothetical protein EU537_05695 [Candidatus Thorarchaeota archaeon]|nr:MAG: hypothetical protein EU537_05695 [Candidatus Thorarchaeota archaeon]
MTERPTMWKQPIKWIVGVVVTVILTAVYWFVFQNILMYDLAITGAWAFFGFAFLWFTTGHVFQLWPANRITDNRYAQGVIMTILGIIYMALAVYVYMLVNGISTMAGIVVSTPFVTNVIFMFGVWIFWLDYWPGKMNREEPIKQPWMGLAILTFSVVAGFLVLDTGTDIPWIWFPISISQLLLFETWPFQELEQPGKGIVLLPIAGFFTWLYAIILDWFGISFFTTLQGPTFTVILVFWTLAFVVYGNMWPLRKVSQPAKGLVSTAISIVAAIATYYVTAMVLPLFGVDWFFALILWAVFVLWEFIVGFTIGWWFFGYGFDELSGESPSE